MSVADLFFQDPLFKKVFVEIDVFTTFFVINTKFNFLVDGLCVILHAALCGQPKRITGPTIEPWPTIYLPLVYDIYVVWFFDEVIHLCIKIATKSLPICCHKNAATLAGETKLKAPPMKFVWLLFTVKTIDRILFSSTRMLFLN